ncbi:MAG: hypothetical protein M1822_009806 [Bathelium mastoideum]|nr:MAG: hypothetical protein M1822_009806 [Bathelium mastoideum]
MATNNQETQQLIQHAWPDGSNLKQALADEDSDKFTSAKDRDLVNIDDNGDIILWTKTKGFRVNSAVLVLASPVFKAMFRPNQFLEGSVPRFSTLPYNLSLGDDSDAMKLLCDILHFNTPEMPIPIDMLAQLGQLCIKYQCNTVVKEYAFKSMRQHEPHSMLELVDCKMVLLAAYAFDLEDDFAWAMDALAFRIPSNTKSLSLCAVLPDAVESRYPQNSVSQVV